MAKGQSFFARKRASLRYNVLYVDAKGWVYVSLPLFVDTAGQCHSTLAEGLSGTQDVEPLESSQDQYISHQLAEMREMEERRRRMTLVLEDLVQNVRQRQRRQIQANLAKMTASRSHIHASADNMSKLSPTERELLMRDVFGTHAPLVAPKNKRAINVDFTASQAPTRCAYSPRGRKSKSHQLQQPKAVY